MSMRDAAGVIGQSISEPRLPPSRAPRPMSDSLELVLALLSSAVLVLVPLHRGQRATAGALCAAQASGLWRAGRHICHQVQQRTAPGQLAIGVSQGAPRFRSRGGLGRLDFERPGLVETCPAWPCRPGQVGAGATGQELAEGLNRLAANGKYGMHAVGDAFQNKRCGNAGG